MNDGYVTRTRRWSFMDVRRLTEMAADRRSARAIARVLGRSPMAVWVMASRLKVRLHGVHGRPRRTAGEVAPVVAHTHLVGKVDPLRLAAWLEVERQIGAAALRTPSRAVSAMRAGFARRTGP